MGEVVYDNPVLHHLLQLHIRFPVQHEILVPLRVRGGIIRTAVLDICQH